MWGSTSVAVMIVAGVMLGMVAGTPIINTPDNARVGADVHPGPPQWLSDFQRGTTLEEIVPAALVKASRDGDCDSRRLQGLPLPSVRLSFHKGENRRAK